MNNLPKKQKSLKGFLPYAPREYLSKDSDLSKKDEVLFYLKKLLQAEVKSEKDLRKWVFFRFELESALDQAETVLYIDMTCHTDDAVKSKSYSEFIKKIKPLAKQYKNNLDVKYLSLFKKYGAIKRLALYDKTVKSDVEIFVRENIPIETQLNILSQEYQKTIGGMSVHYKGEEHTLPRMNKYLFEPDRERREDAWREIAKRRLADKEKLEDIFNRMVSLRAKIAKNTGFENYAQYTWKAMHRFDYTPKDCKKYHQAVEEIILPVCSSIYKKRRSNMGLEALRPWDLQVDPLNRPPLCPFRDSKELISGCRKIFNKMDKGLEGYFKEMEKSGMLDLESRKGKAPGGYMSTLNEARRPFIFMNAVGLDDDLMTLLHESGHAFHSIACRNNPVLHYRHAPLEFSEVASMSMELLASKFLSVFYDKKDMERSNYYMIEEIVFLLVWIAIVDCFQHWIYENPTHDSNARREAWLAIKKRFAVSEVDWSGLDEEHAYLWHKQLHIFEVPFYYIEYGIAQIGAVQLWAKSRKNYSAVIKSYKRALALGGERPLPELFRAAGASFDFFEKSLRRSRKAIVEYLG
ncbi:MAG: M3 family oligoendopeptidase [Candidatus Omnitrophica bacterium]|nr:M3 family oligoendopeptidase [Candidatus Omnitrophota bacterium]